MPAHMLVYIALGFVAILFSNCLAYLKDRSIATYTIDYAQKANEEAQKRMLTWLEEDDDDLEAVMRAVQ